MYVKLACVQFVTEMIQMANSIIFYVIDHSAEERSVTGSTLQTSITWIGELC